jgi:hypothetical protein
VQALGEGDGGGGLRGGVAAGGGSWSLLDPLKALVKRLPFVVCCFVSRVRRRVCLLSLSFGFSFLGVFSLAGSGRSFFPCPPSGGAI